MIPFNRASVQGNEERYIADSLRSGHISGDGRFTLDAQRWFERELGTYKALMTTSCTHALELAGLLLELKPGDEVIVPSYTFPSTANAFVLRGARPVFVDIRPDTLNLDETKVEKAITAATKAICLVHYAGVACEMDSIMSVSSPREIPIIEDNAHGLFAQYKGRNLGTFGSFSAQSFHETKNITCGEGGALFINDPKYVERAEILREKGTDRSRFFRGMVDKYTWVDVGSSYLPSELLAAMLYAQLEVIERIQYKRRRIWECYYAGLGDWAGRWGIALPIVPEHCRQSYHMFYVLMPSFGHRQAFIKHLRARDIMSVFHYLPLHLSGMGQRFGGRPGDCPVAETVSDRLVRLPFYTGLSIADQEAVVQAVCDFRC